MPRLLLTNDEWDCIEDLFGEPANCSKRQEMREATRIASLSLMGFEHDGNFGFRNNRPFAILKRSGGQLKHT